MSKKSLSTGAKSVNETTIGGSELDGIVSIEAPEDLDIVVGGEPQGPPAPAPSPSPTPSPLPPYEWPGETPIPVPTPYPTPTPSDPPA